MWQQTACVLYCTWPCNICDLLDEILHLIFEHVASGGGTNIGLMRDTWTDSLRVQCLLNDVIQPMVHRGENIMRCLDGTSSLWSGVGYHVTICKLIRMAGKFSGLSVQFKELFGDHHRWYQSVICLVTTGLPGCSMYMILSHPKVTLPDVCYYNEVRYPVSQII